MKSVVDYACLACWIVSATVSFATGEMRQVETDSGAATTYAATELNENATLEDYLNTAALNNPGLQAAFHRWQAALERIPQARSLPDPQFNYTYFIEEVETRVGPQRQKFGLSQTFPWFGTLGLREDAATAAADAAGAQYATARLHLFERVKSTYHEQWYLGRAIEVTREHVRLVKHMEGVARTRFKTGVAPHSAVLQAQVELGKLADRLRALEALQMPVAARLNAALNRPLESPLPLPASIPAVESSFTDAQAMGWMAEHSPDLQRIEHLLEQAEAGVGLAERSRYPDMRVGVDYVDTDDALNAGVVDSGKDSVMAMVSVSLPLWYGKHRAAGREARQHKAAIENERADAERRLEAALAMALYHFRDAERKIELYGKTLVLQAEQSVKVARKGFESGETSFTGLIDAQRLLLEFQLAHQRAQADRGQRLAEIEVLVGREIGGRKPETGGRRTTVGEGEER